MSPHLTALGFTLSATHPNGVLNTSRPHEFISRILLQSLERRQRVC